MQLALPLRAPIPAMAVLPVPCLGTPPLGPPWQPPASHWQMPADPVEVDRAEDETADRFKKICQLLNCSLGLPTRLGGGAMGCLPRVETESQEHGTGRGRQQPFPFR